MDDRIFTSGRWTVRPGQEDQFIAAWREFAEWTKAHHHDAGWVVLLRDQEHSNQFTSLGPWLSAASVDAWRQDEGFRSRIGGIRALLDNFEAASLEPVLELQ